MPDKFDPYREALVLETLTIWPEEYDELDRDERSRVETALHGDPQKCAHLDYIRTHTGFCRQITVTAADIERTT